ncbi:MAG: guanylate kinase [Verrucomicrobiales bacterium]|jgi:guanylate kinase
MSNSSTPSRLGILCVVSGPSGAGKTTLCHALSEADPNVVYSVSCTTRKPRPGEIDGSDYHFLSTENFLERAAAGEFLEHAPVHDRHYGTLRSWVTERLEKGLDIVMDIDVDGGAQVRASDDPLITAARVDIFVRPPDNAELENRLRSRGTESEEEFALRMKNALAEIEHWPRYQYQILSGSKGEDFAKFRSIIEAERLRTSRLAVGERE